MTISISTDSLKKKLLFEMKNIISNEIEEIDENSISFEELSLYLNRENFEQLKSILKETKIVEIKKAIKNNEIEFQVFIENMSKRQMQTLQEKRIVNEFLDIFNQLKILIIKTHKGEKK